jgi:putative protease
VIHDNEKKKIAGVLDRARKLGVEHALIGNIGHIQFAKKYGMSVHGDFGLNVYNSETLFVLQKLGLKSATISFELPLTEIRELSKPIDTELITYGRLPLMITENCIVRNSTDACTCDSFTGLVDENGALFPVEPEFGCRNVLLNSKKLFMADKRRTISSLGIWAERLCFTTENAIECVTVLKRYMGLSNFTPPGYTRGMYYRTEE